jgi:hypothetical protein
MLKTHIMKRHFISLVLLLGLVAGIRAQEQQAGTSVAISSETSISPEAGFITGGDQLRQKAEENTRFFLKRYGISGDVDQNELIEAYLGYLTTSKDIFSGDTAENQARVIAESEQAMFRLKQEIKRITGKELDPCIPR